MSKVYLMKNNERKLFRKTLINGLMPRFLPFFYYDICHMIIAIILLVYHKYRLFFKSKTEPNDNENMKVQNMQYIAYVILVLNLLRPLSTIIIQTTNAFAFDLLNDFTCRCVWWLIPTMIYTLNKFAIHLFIVMRTRLSLRKGKRCSISLKIGVSLMMSDVLLLLFTPVNILCFGTMQYVGSKCIWTATHWNNINLVGAWTVVSDFIISLYCLFIFILPLRKLIEFERNAARTTQKEQTTQDSKNNIQAMVERIIFYSTIMLVTTMASYIVFIAHFALGCMFISTSHTCPCHHLYVLFSVCGCFGLDAECILCGDAILTNRY